MSQYKGSCLCGAVQYQVDNIGSKMGHCHCSMCRKFHGAAFATFGEVKTNDFKWTQGEAELKSFQAQNGTVRKFCQQCGSSLIFVPSNDSGEVVEFSLATLDDDIIERPDAHIFVDSKANWYEIEDQLPRHKDFRSTE